MFNDDIDGAFHCDSCGETFPDALSCPGCHEGRCAICGELIAKGAPHATGSSDDVFCEPCDKLAAEESAAEIAERLATPVVIEEQATEPTVIEEYEPIGSCAANVFRRLAAAAVLLLTVVVGAQGCAARSVTPAAEVESVGTLAGGPSVYSAPLAHDAPPALAFVPGSGDDDVSSTVTTETRIEDAPEVVGKGGGLSLGGAR